jgi:hypothetical protein
MSRSSNQAFGVFVWLLGCSAAVAASVTMEAWDPTQHGKSEAVTDAQRALMKSTQFSHPYYWATFTLTGDWN